MLPAQMPPMPEAVAAWFADLVRAIVREEVAATGGASAPPPVNDLADRVWLAYHALPRDAKGRPPSRRKVEIENNLPRSIFSKLFTDERGSIGGASTVKLAKALAVSTDWLLTGEGTGPTPTGHVPPRCVPSSYLP